MRALLRASVVLALAFGLAGTAPPGSADLVGPATPDSPRSLAGRPATIPARQAEPVTSRESPLTGVTIALDPGHQLGNQNHPEQTNALVPAGGFDKPCNTTGTATDSGVAEATVNFRLAGAVRERLEALGARVRLTRPADSQELWGPCIDARGRFGRRVGAELMVSLHADGAAASSRGFHVIAPTKRAPWTTDIADESLRLATSLRDGLTAAGVPRSNYVGAGTGLQVRDDLGTLNLSDVPVAMIEIGNMRNPDDAQRMTSRAGLTGYVDAVERGIRMFLGR